MGKASSRVLFPVRAPYIKEDIGSLDRMQRRVKKNAKMFGKHELGGGKPDLHHLIFQVFKTVIIRK